MKNTELIAEYQPKESTDKAWIRQPLSLLRRDGGMSKAAAVLLAVIIDRATDYNPPRPVSADIRALAWAAGYSDRATRSALHELVSLGLIETRRTGRASVYTLTGAVELLPPKKRNDTQSGTQGASSYRSRQRSKQPLTQQELDYLSLDAARRGSAPEVCAAPAELGDPDYEL